MKTIYAIPNFECNLSCPHCEIRKLHSEYDSKKFLNTLSAFNTEDMIILFGGEPLFYYDRFIACLLTHKIKTVSTNLLLLTLEIINDLKTYKISLTTSWNLLRFTDLQQTLWIDKLRLLSQNSLKTLILMTMTKDLIDDFYLADSKLIKILTILNSITSVESIMFEDYIGEDTTIDTDRFLMDISKIWNFSFRLSNVDLLIKNRYQHSCNLTYTLNPDGTLIHDCPHGGKNHILIECLTCKYSNICKPCRKLSKCSFPKNTYLSFISK